VDESGTAVCYPALRLPSQTARVQFKVIRAVYLGSNAGIDLH